MAPYHILSIDGGGIRGLLAAAMLERLEEAVPGFISNIDLFAGTSTGAILALGLAAGFTPTQARELYERCGEDVFQDSLWDNIHDLGNLAGAQYANRPLREHLTEQFGYRTLAELPANVLISAFDLDGEPRDPYPYRSWKAKFFHNYPGPDSDGDQLMVDVAMRSCAAPTFFPVVQGYIDGGVVANNPSMCALAQALHPGTGRQRLRDVRLLSLGTGLNPRYLAVEDSDWGLVQWAPHLVSLTLEGSAGLADYQCRQIMGSRYLRINPLLPKAVGLDKVEEIPLLKQIARNADLDEAIDWMKKIFDQRDSPSRKVAR